MARALIAAEAAIPTADFPSGNAEVDQILRDHGIIWPPRDHKEELKRIVGGLG